MYFNPSALVESLYIHWPFCPYKCHFCPFVALAGHEEFMERYHQALLKEICLFAQTQENLLPIKTVYFGGGTPSTYPVNLLLDMFGTLNNVFKFDQEVEISLEVNPGTVTVEKLKLWNEIGINRLSVGVQSLNDEVLKKLNRHQKSADVFFLLQEGSKLFSNISVDTILGLPGITSEQWQELISKLVAWPIKHVSMYFLTIHEDTPLYFGIKQQKITLPCEESIIAQYYYTVEQFSLHGFYQYEVSNFGKPGYESRHNSTYWQRKPYKAFGLGACSFDGKTRLQNEKNLLRYLESIEQGKNNLFFYEELTDKQLWLEMLMLGLRQSKGVLMDTILAPLLPHQRKQFLGTVDLLIQEKLIVYDKQALSVTARGYLVVNEITVKLAESYH